MVVEMLDELDLPCERETGLELIRRLGMMLGHVRFDTSDLALPDPANLERALAVTSSIMDEIEALCPGAFAGASPELKIVGGAAA